MAPFLIFLLGIISIGITTADTLPNIIYILADDLGFGDVGYNQERFGFFPTEIVTNNIDSLARYEGLRLTRHYTHYSCTPTRSSLQSGRLPTHVQMTLIDPDEPNSGVPRNMTLISSKFREAGYNNYMVGKWDIGMATFDHLPAARGYNESLFYYSHHNEFWNQQILSGRCFTNKSLPDAYHNIVDLWMSNDTYNGPAFDLNGTNYEEWLFADKVYEIIHKQKDMVEPFYLFFAPHATHSPLQVPKRYYENHIYPDDENLCAHNIPNLNIYPRSEPFNITDCKCRSLYHAMLQILDEIIGNIVRLLKVTNQWDNTLIVFSGDNGANYDLTENAGNNYPLKGAKYSQWEGGVLSTAFVTGGYLPENRRGEIEDGIIHICDWWATFCDIIGVEPNDTTADQYNLPQIDSVSVWDLITGETTDSPRRYIFMDNDTLIDGNYKYLESASVLMSWWSGPIYPNASTNIIELDFAPKNISEFEDIFETEIMLAITQDCSHGCLYDVIKDPSEYTDLSKKPRYKRIIRRMKRKLNEFRPTLFTNEEIGVNACPPGNIGAPCACWMSLNVWNGYFGPYQYFNYTTVGYYDDQNQQYYPDPEQEPYEPKSYDPKPYAPQQQPRQPQQPPITPNDSFYSSLWAMAIGGFGLILIFNIAILYYNNCRSTHKYNSVKQIDSSSEFDVSDANAINVNDVSV